MSRVGISRRNGTVLTGWDECRQSIEVIASTAIGSLVLNRSFGSKIPSLVDAPMSPPAMMAHFMAIAEALRKWEPGYRLKSIALNSASSSGAVSFTLAGVFYPNGHLGDYSIAEYGRGTGVMAVLAASGGVG